MPNIHDVAREAGVGVGTVSRVLNSSPLVSDDLRQRVLAAIERLGYQPSPAARALGLGRTHTLEILVPVFIRSFFLDVLQGIESALEGSDFTLLVRTMARSDDRERALEACCSRARTDGTLVLWTFPTERLITRIQAESFPILLVNAVEPHFSSISADHDAAARGGVEYCMRLGHRRIALIDRHQDVFDPTSTGICSRGYREALSAAGIGSDGYERTAEVGQAGGAQALEALLALPEPPTAVIAASDEQAVGVFLAARERGLQVPRDLSIVGYSDSPYTEYLGLTTIDIKARDLGREATSALLGAIAEPSAAPQTTYRPTQLVVRRTCGAPAVRG